jgi:hypothetical protein
MINSAGLGGLSVATGPSIQVSAPLTMANGGQVSFVAPNVDIAAPVMAHAGAVSITNLLTINGGASTTLLTAAGTAGVTLEATGSIDTSGLWTNTMLDLNNTAGEGFINGGSVSIDTTQGITLAAGSVISASSGGAIVIGGTIKGGHGGNITLIADDPSVSGVPGAAVLTMGGTLQAYGVTAGGALTLAAPSVLIGDGVTTNAPGQIVLPSAFFTQGFSNYTITGYDGVTVAPGTQVNVVEPVYHFTAASYEVPTGTAPSAALSVWTPPLYIQNPLTAMLTQRASASITLNGNDLLGGGGIGPVTIGAGALLAVDPGQWISITSPSQITVAGTLRAPGGNIAIINDGGMAQTPDLNPDGLSIFISSGATLDVAAQAFTATDIWGRTYGVAPSGGSILLGTNQTAFKNGYIGSVDAFIIVQQNALLDASGARAVVDGNTLLEAASGLLGTRAGVPTTIAGNGGSITMTSYDGIYVDGTMAARAGGPGAAGGTLSVTLETPDYSGHSGPVPAAALLVPRVITISQGALAPRLPAGLESGANDRSLQFGQARFSADTLNAAGFDNLAFTARDVILFNGNVNLRAGQSIAFHEGAIADTSANATVTISAPYVLLDGHTPVNVPQNSYYPTIWVWSPSKQQSTGTFSVNADLIDIEDDVRFGVNSPAQTTGSSGLTGTPIAYDYAGFANVNLTSQGDIRFTASTPTGTVALIPPQQGTATLVTSGSLTFTAEQLYPVSNSIANITAGYVGNNASLNPNSVLTIVSVNNVVPAVPYSVNGTITFDAATIDQGGVVRAPLGSVTLGTTNNTVSVNLLPGSITSSSGNGLIIPYGGTPDGTTYNYDGVTFAPYQFGNTVYYKNVVSLQRQSINVQHGATVDVSGGGELAGAGFISGEGGSVNVMATPLVNANPANSFSHAGDQVYAIIPGYQNGYGPVDNSGGTMPGIGQQITITQSVPGLAAGTYTLLPANYAILPGALRIEIGGAITQQRRGHHPGLRRYRHVFAGQCAIGPEPHHDHLRRQYSGLVGDRRHQCRQGRQDHSGLSTAPADLRQLRQRRVGADRALDRRRHRDLEPDPASAARQH